MEGAFLLVIAWAFLFFIVFPVWVILALRKSQRKTEEALRRLEEMEATIAHMQRAAQPDQRPAQPSPPPPPPPPKSSPPPRPTPPPFVPPRVDIEPPPESAQPLQPPPPPPPPEFEAPSGINWERFMGVNLFAWIGGFILFLAAAFFVKYSIDNNLISPQVRVAIGFLLGAGLLVAGLRLSLKDYKVTAHTLCATGVVILYASIFAAQSFYNFISITLAFLLMILTTAAAILLAIRLDAKVVALLGLAGGFLTPLLLPATFDNASSLFGYIAFLDAGLIVVALRKRWNFLVIVAAVATVILQIHWTGRFFEINRIHTAMGILFLFQAIFLAAFIAAERQKNDSPAIIAASILMPFAALCFTFYFQSIKELGERPGTLFLFALVGDLCLMALPLRRSSLGVVHRVAGAFIFLLLATWTTRYLSQDLLYWALGLYLVFAVLHSVPPLLFSRLDPNSQRSGWDQMFAPMALLLAMIPVFRLSEISVGFWFVVLLIDAVAILVSIMTGSLGSILAVVILTLFSILAWLLRMPVSVAELPEFLSVTGAFALIFFAVGIFAGKRISVQAGEEDARDKVAQVPSLAAILPFLLLIIAVVHLPMDHPSPVFGLALLLTILVLGLARMLGMGFLSMIALASVMALEYAWHNARFKPELAPVPLLWYLTFYAVFALFPFLFRRTVGSQLAPWIASALSAPLHFYLIYRLVLAAYPNQVMGLLPLAFSIPSFVALIQRLRELPRDNPDRNAQLAWFGGVTLFFITLIFPVQFERQWILIGWALEGAALLWLFHRIPHQGLRIVGVGLLAVSFLGLVNPGFFLHQPRSTIRIFNWYLYTYGIVIGSLMAAGGLLRNPDYKIGTFPVRPALNAMGTLLAFLLMNIEIADYYSTGAQLEFRFSGNFARDMTYSIAWACFAFVILIVGIRKNLPAARYASISLIGITLVKLFFHDLAELTQLYRVGALVGVAIVLILASYLYQRFVSFDKDKT